MSERILSPSDSSGIGFWIQASRAGETQAWPTGRVGSSCEARDQNLVKSAFESASAIVARGVEHRRIFDI